MLEYPSLSSRKFSCILIINFFIKFIRNHKDIIDLIIKHGKLSKFEDAAKNYTSQINADNLYTSNSQCWFMPNELKNNDMKNNG